MFALEATLNVHLMNMKFKANCFENINGHLLLRAV